MRLPNFLIIGAGRSGTTSLYHCLQQHPEVFMSTMKEPGFFTWDTGSKDPRKPWRSYPIRTLTEYSEQFSGAGSATAVGEATPTYLSAPGTASRIFHLLPEVRLIATLRNPVDRAFASYLGTSRDGRETRPFEDVVEEELLRAHSGVDLDSWREAPAYLYAGLYHTHLTDFMSLFPRERIHVILFEDLQSDLDEVLAGIGRFLGVDPNFDFDTSVRYNVSGVPRSVTIERLTGKNPLTLALKRSLPGWIQKPAYRLAMGLRNRNLDRPAIPAPLRGRLLDYYREDIIALQSLVDRDLSGWLQPRSQ